jgi:hypothetical protein
MTCEQLKAMQMRIERNDSYSDRVRQWAWFRMLDLMEQKVFWGL